MTECRQEKFSFQGINGKRVEGRFDGGKLSTEGGLLLIREVMEGQETVTGTVYGAERSQAIDCLRRQSVRKDYRQLIHHDIPALSLGPPVGEVAHVEEQDLDDCIIVRKDLPIRGIFSHLSIQALDGVGGIDHLP